MANILVTNNFYQGTSDACILDLTPPTFAGINYLNVQSRGEIRAGWAVATDPTPPIRYEVYIQASTAVGLFNTTNIIAISDKLFYDIFKLPDGTFLQNGTTYYVGVRAIDGVNNRNTNTVSLSVISTGVLTSIDVSETKASFRADHHTYFTGPFWAHKNSSLAISPDAVLGTASYQIYDRAGLPIVGLSESGITANAQGLYIITPVPNTLEEASVHYNVKVTINVDSEDRIDFVAIPPAPEAYEVAGISSLDSSNNLIGSFWVTENEEIITTGLGVGSYQAFDAAGNLLVGLSETGITADANGIYSITPFPLPPSIDTSQAYAVRVTLTVHGTSRSHVVVIAASPTAYTNKATFSINASNQLESTFWASINGEIAATAILGTASYQIYDKTGTAVVGLSQTGITADANGLFHSTPVSAALLTDLTHYNAKITISVAGKDRITFKGFTLLGT
jgi:hypothetical protein